MLRRVFCRAARASSNLRNSRSAAIAPIQNAAQQRSRNRSLERLWSDCSSTRGLATKAPQQHKTAEELLQLIEQSREEEDSERELELSLELYERLKKRGQQDMDTFQAAFGIAQTYDEQLDNRATATTFYMEALQVLETISTETSAWGAYMRMTTLGALAVCYEDLEQPDRAEEFFDLAISAYEKHCARATASAAGEQDASEEDIELLADLNATAAMIQYHYAGNLLAQQCWEEAKTLTENALVLAENSSMSTSDLGELQRNVHDLWLEMDKE